MPTETESFEFKTCFAGSSLYEKNATINIQQYTVFVEELFCRYGLMCHVCVVSCVERILVHTCECSSFRGGRGGFRLAV